MSDTVYIAFAAILIAFFWTVFGSPINIIIHIHKNRDDQ